MEGGLNVALAHWNSKPKDVICKGKKVEDCVWSKGCKLVGDHAKVNLEF